MIDIPFICFNGDYIKNDKPLIEVSNRAFRYGDGLFETMHAANDEIQFISDHYNRLINSARIIKIEIPSWFTKAYVKEKVNRLIHANKYFKGVRIRLSIFRAGTGKFTPESNAMHFLIETEPLQHIHYQLNEKGLMVDVYPEIKKPVHPLFSIKSSNSLFYIMAAVYKAENGFDDCLLLNERGHICEAISSNVFMVKDNTIYTPPLHDGCIPGIMRLQILKIAHQAGFTVNDRDPLKTDSLMFADELFFTNAIAGIQWVVAYRNNRYFNKVSTLLNEELNRQAFL